jgi:hypothetical protein
MSDQGLSDLRLLTTVREIVFDYKPVIDESAEKNTRTPAFCCTKLFFVMFE